MAHDLYGSWKTGGQYAAIKIDVRPCSSSWVAFDGTVHGGSDDCVWDQKENIEYLGEAINTLVMYNYGVFR